MFFKDPNVSCKEPEIRNLDPEKPVSFKKKVCTSICQKLTKSNTQLFKSENRYNYNLTLNFLMSNKLKLDCDNLLSIK